VRLSYTVCFACSQKLLESGWGHYKTLLKRVKQWFLRSLQYLLFLQYSFNWTAGKMASAITHQRNILEIQKLVEVFYLDLSYSFVSNNLNSISGPSSFKYSYL
jgi:hypothetical protein